jgi:hypothetical protein
MSSDIFSRTCREEEQEGRRKVEAKPELEKNILAKTDRYAVRVLLICSIVHNTQPSSFSVANSDCQGTLTHVIYQLAILRM